MMIAGTLNVSGYGQLEELKFKYLDALDSLKHPGASVEGFAHVCTSLQQGWETLCEDLIGQITELQSENARLRMEASEMEARSKRGLERTLRFYERSLDRVKEVYEKGQR